MRVFYIKDSIHEIVQHDDNDVRLRIYSRVTKRSPDGGTIPLRKFEEEIKLKSIDEALAYYDNMLAEARRLFG